MAVPQITGTVVTAPTTDKSAPLKRFSGLHVTDEGGPPLYKLHIIFGPPFPNLPGTISSANFSWEGTGSDRYSLTGLSLEQVNQALDEAVFTIAADRAQSGSLTINFQVVVDDHLFDSGKGIFNADPLVMTYVNDAPYITSDPAHEVQRNGFLFFSRWKFNYADAETGWMNPSAPSAYGGITVVSLPTNGKLFLDRNNNGSFADPGEAVLAGEFITAEQIEGYKFTFNAGASTTGPGGLAGTYTGPDSFVYSVNDGFANSGNAVMNIRIYDPNGNNSPSLTGSFSFPAGGIEDDDGPISGLFSNITAADPDGETDMSLAIRFTNGDKGMISGTLFSWQTLSNGWYRLIENDLNIAEINAALDDVIYTPFADRGPGTHETVFTISIDDDSQFIGEISLSSGPLVTTKTNYAPVLTTTSLDVIASEDAAYSFDLTSIGFADADGTTSFRLLIDSLPTHGKLFLDNDSDGRVDVGEEVAVGSLIQRSVTSLKYISDPNYFGPDSYTFRIRDPFDADSAEAGTFNIGVAAVNDLPTLSGNFAIPGAITEDDGPLANVFAGFTVADIDQENDISLTVQMNSGEPGGSTPYVAVGGTVIGTVFTWSQVGEHSYRVEGLTIDQANAALAEAVYIPAQDIPGDWSVIFSLFVDDDLSEQGFDFRRSVAMDVTAVNDAPVNHVPTTTQAVYEGETLTFDAAHGNLIVIEDVDAHGGLMTVTISIEDGALHRGTNWPVNNVTVTGEDTNVFQITGQLVAINEALDGLTWTTTGQLGPRTLTITTNDQGNAPGGALQSVAQVQIQLLNLNALPAVADLAGDTPVYNEHDTLVMLDQGTAASVTDADNANFEGGTLSVTISNKINASETLLLVVDADVSLSGADVLVGTDVVGVLSADGSTGTLTIALNANATHAAVAELIQAIGYANPGDAITGGTRQIEVTLTDGPAPNGASSTTTVQLNVAAVNDVPVLTAPAQSAVSFTEDGPGTPLMQGVTLSDAESSLGFQNGRLTISVGGVFGSVDLKAGSSFSVVNGELVYMDGLNPVLIGQVSGEGTTVFQITSLTAGATLARLNELIDDFVYNNDMNIPFAVNRQVTLNFRDGGNGGTQAQATVTQMLSMVPVNDVPALDLNSGAAGNDVSVNYSENDPGTLISASPTLIDADSDFAGGTLTVSVTAGGNAADRLTIVTGGAITIYNGNQIYWYDADLIGTFTGGSGTDPLVITLSGQASFGSSAEEIADLIKQIGYHSVSEAPGGSREITFTITDGDGGTASAVAHVAIQENDDPPYVHMSDTGPSGSLTYTEDQPAKPIAPTALLLDDSDFSGWTPASLTVSYDPGLGVTGSTADDQLGIRNVGTGAGEIGFDGTNVTYSGALIGTASGGAGGTDLSIALQSDASPAAVQALMRSLTYLNTSQDASDDLNRVVLVRVLNNQGGFAQGAVTVTLVGQDDAPAATVPGAQAALEDTDLVFSGTNAIAVSDVDSDLLTVRLSVANGTLTLSGTAGLTFVEGDGTSNPAMAFSGTVAQINLALEGLRYRGLLNYQGSDTLQVDVSDSADGSALFNSSTIAIALADDGFINGDSGNNLFSGTPNRDIFLLQQGGDDRANGLGGRDVFYFGDAFTAADTVDGGSNSDIVILQGDYLASTSLGSITNLGQLGSISLFSSTNNLYGGASGGLNSYNLVATNETVAAGLTLKINGSGLQADEDVTFDGSAELDGSFQIYGGAGSDHLTGGAMGDNFVFTSGTWNSNDRVTGGGGYDVVYLRGDYTIAFGATQLSGVESIGLLSATEKVFASAGDEFDYVIDWNDALLDSGQTITINGSRLTVEENMDFDGSAETAGSFRLFGGMANDVLTGGAGNDLIYGGPRGDTLTGGTGNDVFRYHSVAESNSVEQDGIQDFTLGDLIDLSRIDVDASTPGDQAFTFIGQAAFSGQKGELRFENISLGQNVWKVFGDTDGDGTADFELVLVITDSDPITATDFLL